MADDLETELRGAFARAAAAIPVPDDFPGRLLRRGLRPRRAARTLAGGAAATLAAAAIGAAAALPAVVGTAAGGPTVQLAASYTFRMPAGYRSTTVRPAPCWARSGMQVFGHPGRTLPASPQAAAIEAGASSAGACISIDLLGIYRPTLRRPDPYAPLRGQWTRRMNIRPVRVGRYHGVIFLPAVEYLPTRAGRPGVAVDVRELLVQLPAAAGRRRDLAICATGLSPAALITIVARGLSS
jgi:hypothetical protein